MSPVIRDSDILTIAPLGGRTPALGEVVVYADSGGRLVVHRLVGLHDSLCETRGDNLDGRDCEVPLTAVLGTVVAIERNGARITAGLGPGRAVIAVLSRHGLLRPLTATGKHLAEAWRRVW